MIQIELTDVYCDALDCRQSEHNVRSANTCVIATDLCRKMANHLQDPPVQ